jgi:hypothetical protein
VTVADRELVVLFGSTLTVIDPLPLPLAGDSVTQAALEEAVHEQPAAAVTVTADVPPVALTEMDVGDTV